jgi:hypothetical protein
VRTISSTPYGRVSMARGTQAAPTIQDRFAGADTDVEDVSVSYSV